MSRTNPTLPAPDLTLSVVIPVLHDLPELSSLLGRLRRSVRPPEQVIVVDAGTADECRRLCIEARCDYVPSEPNRGRQLDAGARAAVGDIVWFLHADALPPSDGPVWVRRHITAGNLGGYFDFSFAGETRWYTRLLAMLINLRARVGIPYGDQGLFLTRDAYTLSGGFAPTPLFEEVPLVRGLRRIGRFASVGVPIGVSPRRWERDGWVRRTVHNRMLALAFVCGVPPARLARRYRAVRRAETEHVEAGPGGATLTPSGQPAGYIQPHALEELWLHTGTACNLECPFCLEGSKPGDDRIERITLRDVQPIIDEALTLGVKQLSFTGGEPFIVRDFIRILGYAASHRPCLVLTNGTAPVLRRLHQIRRLADAAHPVAFRISIDHWDEKLHDEGRGAGSFARSIEAMRALVGMGFCVSVARQMSRDEDAAFVDGHYREMLASFDLPPDMRIVPFPDFGPPGKDREVPEITEDCMTRHQTQSSRREFMCAFSKMVVKKSGRMRVYACTLVDDDEDYDCGGTLSGSMDRRIVLAHHRCYSCFAYGSSCSELDHPAVPESVSAPTLA